MLPWGYQFRRPPEEDLTLGYESMIRGLPQATSMEAPERQLGLMRLLRPRDFYGPSQGFAGPVPRGTFPGTGPSVMYGPPPSPLTRPPVMQGPPPEPIPAGAQDPYAAAMGLPETEPYGPPEPAIRVPERGGYGEESEYRRIADEYLRSLQQPYRMPEPTPYSKREKLALLAAREPWQREMIVSQHREPYERAMAEMGITEKRRASAAGVASDLEKAQAYERLQRARANQPSQELDYTDKVEKAQADVPNVNYPYTRPQWKALAEAKAEQAGAKLAGTREGALKQLDDQIRKEEDQILQARSDLFGQDLGLELSADRQRILNDANERKRVMAIRRKAIASMTEEIYRKFWRLTSEQQEDVFRAYEKRMAGAGQQGGGQLGPVAPQPSYYP